MKTQDICYGRVIGYGWAQEWYETESKAAGRRARELRALGYKVHAEAMGSQVTNVGRVRMTLVDIRGTDALPAHESPAPARIERGV